MHTVGFYIYPGHQILDLAGPFGAFESVTRIVGHSFYELSTVSRAGGRVCGSGGLPVETSLATSAKTDTLIVVGGDTVTMLDSGEVEVVAALAGRTARVASVCTGAFLLAKAGLLDGRRATTHWRMAHRLQQEYPAVKVESDRIFTEDSGIWTSAGVTAGIDLALALIETDLGIDVARRVASELVVYHRRSGGQSQFSPMSLMDPETDRMRMALSFMRDHLHEPLSIERIAEAVNLSPRQFGRNFRRETGETPARAVERLRSEAAMVRLQAGSEPIEWIAGAVGFGDPERMRRAFIKIYGKPPQAVRRADKSGRN